MKRSEGREFEQSANSLVTSAAKDAIPRIISAVARKFGDFADAEDAVQEALVAALAQWPVAGLPSNPTGWLYQVALRRMHDGLRADRARDNREQSIAEEQHFTGAFMSSIEDEIDSRDDDSLLMLFMCCHPALSTSSAVALTLRAVGGLSTSDIARAFLVPEATMAQRISRAKASIKSAGACFVMPDASEHTTRVRAVLHVLYLMFSEGYTASSGSSLQRVDLSDEAIRLARELCRVMPVDSEAGALLALMLLTDARKRARVGEYGELIPLDEQDRSQWNASMIREGTALLTESLGHAPAGLYQLQAAIAALHDEAPDTVNTDWPQIIAL